MALSLFVNMDWPGLWLYMLGLRASSLATVVDQVIKRIIEVVLTGEMRYDPPPLGRGITMPDSSRAMKVGNKACSKNALNGNTLYHIDVCQI